MALPEKPNNPSTKNQTELSTKEQRTLNRLHQLKQKLERGEHVQNRTLKTWIGIDAVHDMEQRWKDEKDSRPKSEDKPSEIVEYERLLKRANFVRAKAETASSRSKSNAGALYNKVDTEYERALEYIQEQVGADSTLQTWLDRPAIVAPSESGTGIDFNSMPRVITSRSQENQSSGVFHGEKLTKRDIKIEAVEQAISALENKLTDEQEADLNAKVKGLIKGLRSE